MNYSRTMIDGAEFYSVAIADYRRKRWLWKVRVDIIRLFTLWTIAIALLFLTPSQAIA